MIKKAFHTLVLIGFLIASALTFIPHPFSAAEETLRIALIGPMSGPDAAQGRAMVAGASQLIDEVNRAGGVGGKRVELVVRDDVNDPDQARQRAAEVVRDGRVLAVLGHLGDAASSAAGPIYRDGGLPAVTGGNGVREVAVNNKWVFRAGLTTAHQAVFLINYVARIMKEDALTVIKSEDDYGRSLVGAMEDELSFIQRMGITQLAVKGFVAVNPLAPDLDRNLDAIAEDLSRTYSGEVLFLAMGADVATRLIARIKDNPRLRFGKPIPFKIVGPDSLGSPSLVEAFARLRRERSRPGLYTDGIRAVAPFLDDIANQESLEFRRGYEKRHRRAPDVIAAGFHDAAAAVVRALGRLDPGPMAIAAARQQVRDRLAEFDRPEKAINGVTGSFHFDNDGNAVKSVPIGVYGARQLISPPLQLSAVGPGADLRSPDVLQIAGNYFIATRIVRSGLHVNKISDIDLAARRARIDFNIWFRFRDDFDLGAIEFPNAAEPVELGTPLREVSSGGETYRLYRVDGLFQTDFAMGSEGFGKRNLGIQVRHRNLNRTKLILVPDLAGMAEGEANSLTELIVRRTIFGETIAWNISRADIYLDSEPIAPMGDPEIAGKDMEGFSRLNLAVWIEPTELSMRGIIEFDLALRLFLLGGLGLGLIGVLSHHRRVAPHKKWLWFPAVVIVFATLFGGEVAAVDWLGRTLSNPYYGETAITLFRILWWFVPAFMIALGVEHFLWRTLERRTGREIPRVVRFFAAGLVYTLALMGVIAFVFDEKVTSLLATSGVLAMIIGLAVQMNLSNIFSGLAINIERPFRIGDWIHLNDYDPGKVVAITWRTTRIETLEKNIICIPNSVASDSTVENLSYPNESYRTELTVHVDPGARPEWVEKFLFDAVVASPGVLAAPNPSVTFQGVMDWSADYAVRYFCKDYEHHVEVHGAVWRNIVRNLRYAGFVSVIHEEFTLFHLSDKAKSPHDLAMLLIDGVDVFQPFDGAKKNDLCRTMKRRTFEAQRTVVTQGEQGDSLFVVAEGALAVEVTLEDGKAIEVGRLGPGDFFGEMALLTGEPRGATVTTVTPSVVYEIAKADIEPIIREFPDIVDDLSGILTHRALENLRRKKDYFASLKEERSLAGTILAKITSFFNLRGREAPASAD